MFVVYRLYSGPPATGVLAVPGGVFKCEGVNTPRGGVDKTMAFTTSAVRDKSTSRLKN